MAKKIVIEYEYADKTTAIVHENPPVFYNNGDYVIFAKGVLADRDIVYDRLLEICITETVYSAYDEGLKALVADEG